MDGVLLLAFVFLAAGIVAVPIASRLGLGSVLGYLIAGIALGPLLEALRVDVVSVQHFAEFGVVMMLFLVGLELEPHRLWQMRLRLLGLGGLQVGGTALLVTGAAMALGQPWQVALAVGLVLALSSTAIVLQTLNETGLMRSDGGQASFAVLLFQDIAVIPMLALMPLLAVPELAELAAEGASHGPSPAADHGAAGHGPALNVVAGLPVWAHILVSLAAIAAVIVGGSRLTRPLFRFVAMANLRELFTATALLMVVGIALLMTVVGLSPALGTFLAGVVLANSEYRHELESSIEPFKGLLLGVFFITVGAAIDFGLLTDSLGAVLGLTAGLMLLKAAVLLALGLVFPVRGAGRWLMALGLAQAGEFGFVLLSFTVANRVIPPGLADTLLLVVTLSMLLTPALFLLFDKVIAPRFSTAQVRPADPVDETGTVIIAGHGRVGGIVNRVLKAAGTTTVVLDHSSSQLEMLRTFGIKVFFGDATRPDLLHAAGIESARVLVVAIDGREQITGLVRYVRATHPHVHVVARAVNRTHVYELYQAGAHDIIRETFDSALRTGRSALEALGMHPYEAERHVRDYARGDRFVLREMAQVYDPATPNHLNPAYVAKTREVNARMEAEVLGRGSGYAARSGRAWAPPTRADVDAVTAEAAQPAQTDPARGS